jgi:hypothetical protein
MGKQLTKGMYGHEMASKEAAFGLRTGQTRSWGHGKLGHNASWFNAAGQKLGWGDFDVDNVHRIIAEIDPDELFIVLTEHESYWDIRNWKDEKSRPSLDEPGTEFIMERAKWIFRHGEAIEVSWRDKVPVNEAKVAWNGLDMTVITREEARAIIMAAIPVQVAQAEVTTEESEPTLNNPGPVATEAEEQQGRSREEILDDIFAWAFERSQEETVPETIVLGEPRSLEEVLQSLGIWAGERGLDIETSRSDDGGMIVQLNAGDQDPQEVIGQFIEMIWMIGGDGTDFMAPNDSADTGDEPEAE